jgi:hypothetical protein
MLAVVHVPPLLLEASWLSNVAPGQFGQFVLHPALGTVTRCWCHQSPEGAIAPSLV